MRRRLPIVLGLLCLGAIGVLSLVSSIASARTTHLAAPKVTVITVTAGKPAELKFTLSKSSNITAGSVTFKVTDKGLLAHDLEVCTGIAKTSAANKCVGKTTPMLTTGKSATLTVTLKAGLHEFLCTVPGHASAGMKGLLGVGVAVPVGSVTGTTSGGTTSGGTTSGGTTSGGTTSGGTTSGGTTSGGITGGTSGGTTGSTTYPPGDPNNGKTIFLGPGGCGGCHALAAAGTPAGDGPALDGTNLSVASVEAQVSQGGGGMPGYKGVLSTQQIADVSTFVSNNST